MISRDSRRRPTTEPLLRTGDRIATRSHSLPNTRPLKNIILAACAAPVLASPLLAQAVPYIPGNSYGPIAQEQNPLLEEDQMRYGEAYWQADDSDGILATLFENFAPNSPDWFSDPTDGWLPTDPAPFADGQTVFEILYAHRLNASLEPGELYLLEDLIRDDPNVAFTWRHWTLHHQVITSASWDAAAHNLHIAAALDAIGLSLDWWTAGVPYADANFLVTDKTKKKQNGGAPAPTPPTPVADVPRAAQAMHQCIVAHCGVLDAFTTLREDDGGWWAGKVGFDCDDYADALAHYLIKDKEGYTSSSVRMTWTDLSGSSAAHRITKVTCGAFYWLADGQGGVSTGPFPAGTPADGSGLLGGYEVDPNRPIRTIDDGRAVGVRTGWAEPYVWSSSPRQRRRFEQITMLDAECFYPN